MTSEQAPNFSRGYPGNGERIGPAWNYLWAELGKADQPGNDLALRTEAVMGISRITALNLLRQARQRGLITVAYRDIGKHKQKLAVYARKAST